SAKQAVEKLFDWAGDSTIVGHNVGFDLGFLSAAFDGFEFPPGTYFDTLPLARDGYPTGPDAYKLGDLSRFFGIELQANHRAPPDGAARDPLVGKLAAAL